LSRRFWRAGARTRTPDGETAAGSTAWWADRPGPDDDTTPGARIVTELLALGAAGRTGALHVVGTPGGLVHLTAGRVVHVECWTVPGVEAVLLRRTLGPQRWAGVLAGMGTSQGRDAAVTQALDLLDRDRVRPVEVDLVHRRAVADAACALLTTPGGTLTRLRFLRDERPWLALSRTAACADLAAEARRLGDRLAAVTDRARPDVPLARAACRVPLRLSAVQWDLVSEPDPATPRELAWRTGRGVAVTTLEAAGLVDAGLLRPATRPDPAPPDPPPPGPSQTVVAPPEALTPQTLAPQTHAPQTLAPQTHAPQVSRVR